jgi:hypothetical protein
MAGTGGPSAGRHASARVTTPSRSGMATFRSRAMESVRVMVPASGGHGRGGDEDTSRAPPGIQSLRRSGVEASEGVRMYIGGGVIVLILIILLLIWLL